MANTLKTEDNPPEMNACVEEQYHIILVNDMDANRV